MLLHSDQLRLGKADRVKLYKARPSSINGSRVPLLATQEMPISTRSTPGRDLTAVMGHLGKKYLQIDALRIV